MRERTMIPVQRRAVVLDIVTRRGAVSIQQLAAEIGVSTSTVRRDLDYLSEHGYLERSFGGATTITSPSTIYEPLIPGAEKAVLEEKTAIGQLAASLLDNGRSVLFDSSSTVLEAAKAAVSRNLSLKCVTNDLATAKLLGKSPNIELVVVGGTCRRGTMTLVGTPGLAFVQDIHVDVGFIGVHAFARGAFCDTSLDVVAMKRQMIKSSRRIIVLAESAKFSSVAFCDICGLEAVDDVVTDEGLSEEKRHMLEEGGVRLHVASAGATQQEVR